MRRQFVRSFHILEEASFVRGFFLMFWVGVYLLQLIIEIAPMHPMNIQAQHPATKPSNAF